MIRRCRAARRRWRVSCGALTKVTAALSDCRSSRCAILPRATSMSAKAVASRRRLISSASGSACTTGSPAARSGTGISCSSSMCCPRTCRPPRPCRTAGAKQAASSASQPVLGRILIIGDGLGELLLCSRRQNRQSRKPAKYDNFDQDPPKHAARSDRVADPAVAQIAAAWAVFDVIGLQLGKPVGCGECCALVEIVEPYCVLGEDPVLDRAVSRAQRLEPVALLHLLRDLETAQPFDLPLRRAGPNRIGAPQHVVGAKPLDERAHQRRGEPRFSDRRPREELSQIAVDIADAVFLRDLGEIAGP